MGEESSGFSNTIEVCFSPALFPVYFENKDTVVVVIDIFRATTAICSAIDHEVEAVIPVATLEEATLYKQKGFIVGAERSAEVVEGFDFGNSPLFFKNGEFKGKTIVLTTTNGTKAIEMALEGNVNDATNFVFSTAYPSVQRWIKNNQTFILHSEEHTEIFYTEARAGQEWARKTMYIIGVLAIVLSIMIVIFLTLGITKPLNLSVYVANKIASGDLTVDTSVFEKRKDEVGLLNLAFYQMVEKLRGSIKDIIEGVNLLGSSASEILAATTQVAAGASETASAISETSATVEEVRQAAQLSSQKASRVSENAQQTAQVTQTGQQAVEETIKGMYHIQDQMESVANTIVRLSEQSQQIGGIIASVNDLADQSNLLAVNAAIEAAKAGEQGKGFTVVEWGGRLH